MLNRFSSLAFVLVFVILACSPSVVNSLSGDDYVHVFKNRAGLDHWFDYFAAADGREYRPIVRLTLAVDHALWGEWFAGFHLTNLLLHLLVTALVYIYAGRMTGSEASGILAAVIFGLHPIHSYNISAVMGRTDLLCSLFALAALLAVGRRTVWAIALFVVALLTKESAVILPLLLLLQLMFEQRSESDVSRKRGKQDAGQPRTAASRMRKAVAPHWRVVLASFAALAIYLALRLVVFPPAAHDLAVYTAASPVGVFRNLAYYAGGLIVPYGHFALRGIAETHPELFLLVAVSILGSVCVVIFSARRQLLGRELLFGTLWVLISLMPVLLIFQRRFLYLASIGLALAAGGLLVRVGHRYVPVVAMVIAVLLGFGLLNASLEWRSASQQTGAVLSRVVPAAAVTEGTLYVLNVPNGHGSAHLFTHDSLRYAVGLETNRLPSLVSLTRINFGQGSLVRTRVSDNRVVTGIRPSNDTYFVFDSPELLTSGGRLLPIGTRFTKGPFSILITGTDKSGRVSEVTVEWSQLPPGDQWIVL